MLVPGHAALRLTQPSVSVSLLPMVTSACRAGVEAAAAPFRAARPALHAGALGSWDVGAWQQCTACGCPKGVPGAARSNPGAGLLPLARR